MTQPRPNADQVRKRFSASVVASALEWWNSAVRGVCLGACVTNAPSEYDGAELYER